MLCKVKAIPLLANPIPIDNLKKLRKEWEDTDTDLLTVKAPVGLVLYDVCRSLGLSPDDTSEVLGNDLYGRAIS